MNLDIYLCNELVLHAVKNVLILLVFCCEGYATKGIVMDVALPKCDCEILAGTKIIWNGTLREKVWPRRLVLPKSTQSVTIKVRGCSNPKVGILASFSNGNVTDGSWSCADSTTCNWKTNHCSSVAWVNASVVANNSDDSTSTRRPEIALKAQWIWISPNSPTNVWCKKTFGKFQYCIKCSVNYYRHTSVCIGKIDQGIMTF